MQFLGTSEIIEVVPSLQAKQNYGLSCFLIEVGMEFNVTKEYDLLIC